MRPRLLEGVGAEALEVLAEWRQARGGGGQQPPLLLVLVGVRVHRVDLDVGVGEEARHELRGHAAAGEGRYTVGVGVSECGLERGHG